MAIQVDEKLEDLYELILRYCNLEPVQKLIRDYKDMELPKDKAEHLKITGKNAREVVTENLKRAVDRKVIPRENVLRLLQEAEENGNQHIFFFTTDNKASLKTLSDRDVIAVKLLGQRWKESGRFPRLRLQPKGYCWSDFRPTGTGGWIAKLYGHDTTEEEAGVERREENERARWVKLITQDIRLVCLARWSPNVQLLELRVADSRAKMLIGVLKQYLSAAVSVDDLCEPWDLSPVRQRLFNDNKKHADLYECGDWLAIDPESYVLQGGPHLQDPDEAVHASQSTQKMISQVAASNEHEKRRLVVHWKPTKANGLKRSLRTILGSASNTHEVIISAQASSQAIDDVVDRLLQFEE
jgi:hypothetical protein